MSDTKFTKRPWKKRRTIIGDFIGISIFSENCPIGLIAKLPFKNEFALIREYKEKFSQEEVDANAQLMSCAPDMYEMLDAIAPILRSASKGVAHDEEHVWPDTLLRYADTIDKLLAKARDEEA